MKFIEKNPEPPAFAAWKQRESESLENLYRRAETEPPQISSDVVWQRLPSNNPIVRDEENYPYFSKKDLTDALLLEQGNICAYCMRRIQNTPLTGQELARLRQLQTLPDADASVEEKKEKKRLEDKFDTSSIRLDHVEPKSFDLRGRTFNYGNIVASCNGGEKIPKPRKTYCDCNKDNDPIGVSPLNPSCELVYYFTLAGEIKPTNPDDEAAKTTITTLGLDFFNESRKETILGFYYEDLDNNIPISSEDAALLVDKLSRRTDEGFEPYCTAIINILKREILNYERNEDIN